MSLMLIKITINWIDITLNNWALCISIGLKAEMPALIITIYLGSSTMVPPRVQKSPLLLRSLPFGVCIYFDLVTRLKIAFGKGLYLHSFTLILTLTEIFIWLVAKQRLVDQMCSYCLNSLGSNKILNCMMLKLSGALSAQ